MLANYGKVTTIRTPGVLAGSDLMYRPLAYLCPQTCGCDTLASWISGVCFRMYL